MLCSAFGAARITLDDLLAVSNVGPVVLSPNGRQFATIRDEEIVLLPADTGPAAILTTTEGAKSELAWSPDSRKLAFVSRGAIWVVSASGGPPRKLTEGSAGMGDPRGAADHAPVWNPRGTWILFESGRHGRNELYAVSEDGKRLNYLAATENYSSSADSIDNGDAVSVDRFDPHPKWSPDGTLIAYTERSRKFFAGKLNVLTFDRREGGPVGDPETIYTAKPDRGGAWSVNAGAWSPDGKTIAVVLQDTGWDKVYLLPAHGGTPKQLTDGDAEDNFPVYSPDGNFLAIVSNRNGLEQRHIWIVPVDGAVPRQLADLGPDVESAPQWSPDGKHIYFVRSTPLDSPNLYVAAVFGKEEVRALTRTLPLDFQAAGFAAPTVVHFKGKDGLPLAGILYKPVGYTERQRYPAVLWIHGGPEGQDTFTFSPWSLYLAQQGYAVLLPNYRGSDGYGEKFRNLNVEDSGGGEVADVAAAAQYLADQGIADPKRIAIAGGSHGGTMVNFAVTKYPDVFAAGIDISGVVNRATFLERTNANSVLRWQTKMGGTPAEKPNVYRQADILPDVAQIKTPILILHGEEDPQVPPYEAAQFAEALKKAGKFYVYVTYPHEGHGFTQREHRLDAWRRELAFLQKYLKPVYGLSSTSTENLVVSNVW